MAKGAVIVKKKKWVRILAPKLFNEQFIGESYVGDVQELVGRKISVSLMTLTNDPQKQTINVTFKITGTKNDTAKTEFEGYKMLPAAAKKLMRRQRNKIEDSFIVESKDKKIVRIKPIIITRGKTTGSVLTTIRKLEKAYLANAIAKNEAEGIIREITQKKLQHGMYQLLKKLHPMAACEIRQLELIPHEKIKELGLKITLPPEKMPEIPKKAEKETEETTQTETTEEKPAEDAKPDSEQQSA